MIFIDDEQRLAAARSLVELDGFRAASGNGLVRRTGITIFYSTPSHDKMGYGRLFSKWLVYCVRGFSLLQYMTQRNIAGEAGHLREQYALFCNTRRETLEVLRRQTILLGLRTTAMQACTRKTMATDVVSFGNDDTWAPPPPSRSTKASHSEEETWARRVKIRNSMEKEFERKWSASACFHSAQFSACSRPPAAAS